MKRFLILVCLISAIPASRAVAADLFPWWFHTRPKPVLVDDPAATPADARNRTPNHTNAASPNWGRANIVEDRRVRQAQPSKSWLAGLFARDRSSHYK
jgi:hypothetical protein